MIEAVEEELKQCPRCELWLPVSEFGVSRARKDGLNLYDRTCINQKIKLHRQRLREYKGTRKLLTRKQSSPRLSSRRVARMLRTLPPVDQVKEAIHGGADTQAAIARVTKLAKDEVGEHIATMLLWDFSIRTEVIDDVRRYFINESGQPRIQHHPVRPHEPRSYGVSNIYESGDPEIRGMSTKYLQNR